MPNTIEKAFSQHIEDLRTAPSETAAAKSHRASISQKLEQVFGMTAFFRTGSFGNGTNVPGYSDVDYFAVLPTDNLKANSNDTLAAVSQAMRDRFPTTANIRVNGPAVRIPFGLDGAEATEIVPVKATGLTHLGFRQFDMPDGAGGWKFSAPESHNAYVTQIDDGLDGRLKPLIKMLKLWKFRRGVPIRSFYLEIYAARYAAGEKIIIPDIDLARVFGRLANESLADLPDPRFPRDPFILYPCNTALRRAEALEKVSRAAQWAAEAYEHKSGNRTERAFDRWDLVFDYQFPTYSTD